MKHSPIFWILLWVILSSVKATAQDNWEEAVYLKSGSIYRGIIIEQVPDRPIKLKTRDGSVVLIHQAEIDSITLARIVAATTTTSDAIPQNNYHHDNTNSSNSSHYHLKDRGSLNPPYEPKRGYFGQLNFIFCTTHRSIRVVNGFRFNRFAELGIGIGLDKYIFQYGIIPEDAYAYNGRSGIYMPIFLHFTGEWFRTPVTPIYALEAGYAFKLSSSAGYSPASITGGLMCNIGGGIKIQTPMRVNIRIAIMLNFQDNNGHYYPILDNTSHHTIGFYENNVRLSISPGIRLGICL
jgi:hypothetical protein